MTEQDADQLRILSILHYVLGGLTCLFSLIPLLHVGMGLMIIITPQSFCSEAGRCPPPFFGWFFLLIGLMVIIMGMSIGIGEILAARWLSERKHYTFCLVVSAIECLMMPLGTILGIFTILVLIRDSVKSAFETPREMTWTRR